ncbi:MAG TPA: four helix bundle protein [Chitinophagaceae bacterium]|nr:four helix bundle protein [Chitinophagaceae bacterium]
METKKFLKLSDIESYRISFHLSNYVWEIVLKWNSFSQRVVGEQFIRAVDSISANIAEGFGRYGKRDKIKFFRYSQGSLNESLDWNQKSKVRKLISKEEYEHIFDELQKLPKAINALVSFTNQKLKI